ncbi:MAG: hypothetical protein GXO02_01125, partial [Epsilonproteobacteria bacterium]|nr:hypothetical protein [Campylobacterota bacterium]
MRKIFFIFLLFLSFKAVGMECRVPAALESLVISNKIDKLQYISDIRRNFYSLKDLCVNLISFKENRFNWKLLLIYNPYHSKGAVWFLPHDNENMAFKSAIYAIKRYGGAFLSVVNNDKRYFLGQDPNRNFSLKRSKEKSCPLQLAPSYKYTTTIFYIIDKFRKKTFPYLSLHNNRDGPSISILTNTPNTISILAYNKEFIKRSKRGLADEDNLIYTSGKSQKPPNIAYKLAKRGINVKYEIVNPY